GDEARIKFDYDATLGSLTEISCWVMTTAGYYEAATQYLAPYITLEIDVDGDGLMNWNDPDHNDVWLLISPYHDYVTTYGEWFEGTWDDNSYARIKGCPLYPDADEDHLLSDLKVETFSGDRTWGDLNVLRVKIGIGTWIIDPHPEVIAYVDDVTINLDTYDLEPPSDEIDGSVTVNAVSLSIVVEFNTCLVA
ncbi:unnamed protein product, partial [marine sediment metagenome]